MDYPSPILQEAVETLPHSPGVYQFFDKAGAVIYVGKAKNLRKRVSSYFSSRQFEEGKLQVLVSKIVDLKFVVVSSEAEAFLLENTLIKKYQPRYNINLKDGKTYPSICIKNEQFPRVFPTRKIYHDGSKYFGPYPSVSMVHVLLNFARELYPLRTCKLNLNPKDIEAGKFKPCLEQHVGNCLGPCIGRQSLEDYNTSIAQITSVLKGSLHEVKVSLSEQMGQASKNLNFEQAQLLKEKLQLLDDFQSKSTVVNPAIGTIDVFNLLSEGSLAFCNFLRIVNGTVVYSYTFEMSNPLNTSSSELLSYAILKLQSMLTSLSREVVVPFLPDESFKGVAFTIPLKGDKLRVLKLSEDNCRAYMAQRLTLLEKTDPDVALEQRVMTMQQDLHLNEPPYHIECFDNSNTQGTNPVAACVVFKNVKPSKRDYRHFMVKSVDSPNDYASMEEIVYRRYDRQLKEKEPLPQLIVIDGGKGQLHAALNALEKLNLKDKIDVVGLAKRLEEIFKPNDSTPLYLNKNSFSLKVLMQIRDEAHRFGITFHMKQRSSKMLQHQLDFIPGIGELSIGKLLQDYNTLARIKEAGYDQVALLLGAKQAKALLDFGFFD
jgi:excinuclease ABC subunit C